MDNQLKELLDEIIFFQNSADVDLDFMDKIESEDEILPGDKIQIIWKDRDEFDYGYVFTLPHQDSSEYDFCVHVTHVDNSDGIDEAPDEFKHLYSLVSLERVKKIVVI